MTLPEMEEQFGTVKQVMKMDCTINGVGQATIMQSEVEGIPLSKIIEYAKPKAGANIVSPIGIGRLRLRPDEPSTGWWTTTPSSSPRWTARRCPTPRATPA